MSTRIVRIDPQHPDPAMLAEAGLLIRSGGLVAFPTETVYGLGANAFDSEAVAGIYLAKGRPASDPIIVHVSEPAQVWQVAAHVPASAERLMAVFFPGPLTLVLPRSERVPPLVSAGLDTVAVRMPSHPVALALIRASGVAIAAPSANRFGRTSPTQAAHVIKDLGGLIPLVLDAGETPIGVESTILDLSGAVPRLLRPGGVPLEALQRVLPDTPIEIVSRFVAVESDEALPAPGMLLRHYAPRAPMTLFDGALEAVGHALDTRIRDALTKGERPGLLVGAEDMAGQLAVWKADPAVSVQVLGTLNDAEGAAARLYAALHALDQAGVTVIFARTFPAEGIGAAVRDRMLRAAEGRVIGV